VRPVGLIAASFLREQRWPLVLLLAFVVVYSALAGLFSPQPVPFDDVLFFVKQQAVYGVAFIGFLAGSAIFNERRSRRILSVLSKAVRRSQYIAGLIGGVLAASAIYCGTVGVFGSLMFSRTRLPVEWMWELTAMLFAACAVTSATSVFFSTFMHPLFAMAAAAITLSFTAAMSRMGFGWQNVLPVYGLMDDILSFSGKVHWTAPWAMVWWSVVQTIVLWVAASCVFSFRDIAVAVE
jgi:ABC-type transport system involved in multi-copper enzyme maturation permease subunit